MKIETLFKRLQAAGLDAEYIQLYGPGGSAAGTIVKGICVNHNYRGYYPTREALEAHEAASNAAYKAGYHAEPRGCYTATYIWRRETA